MKERKRHWMQPLEMRVQERNAWKGEMRKERIQERKLWTGAM